jgi:hypothetical protein
LLDNSEINWIDMMRMITTTKPEVTKTPRNKLSKYIKRNIGENSKFDKTI